MATIVSDADWKSAPKNYAAFHQQYYPFVVNLVAKNGIAENNKEDVASEIFLRLYERRFLEMFNPDLTFEYEGQCRPARFKSFLARVVLQYVRGYCDKQKRLSKRELQICDLQMGDDDDTSDGTGWAELYGETSADHSEEIIEKVFEEQDATAMREYLKTCPKRSVHDACDLVELFDAVRAQVLATGEYDVKELKDRFHIATTTMHNWLWHLKGNMAFALGRPLPAKRARTLRLRAES